MVEYTLNLDSVFGGLADHTRRDILQRVSKQSMTIGQIAKHYDVSFAAISKHIKVLEKASLITKRRQGKEQIVEISPQTLAQASEFLEVYRQLWEQRFDALDKLLKEEQNGRR